MANVEIHTFADAARLSRVDPENAMAARFSIPAVLAADAMHGVVAPDAFDDAALAAEAEFAARVTVIHDPEATALQPAVRRCRAVVTRRDGSVSEATVTAAPGDPLQPLGEKQLRLKFDTLVAFAGRDDAAALFARLVA